MKGIDHTRREPVAVGAGNSTSGDFSASLVLVLGPGSGMALDSSGYVDMICGTCGEGSDSEGAAIRAARVLVGEICLAVGTERSVICSTSDSLAVAVTCVGLGPPAPSSRNFCTLPSFTAAQQMFPDDNHNPSLTSAPLRP